MAQLQVGAGRCKWAVVLSRGGGEADGDGHEGGATCGGGNVLTVKGAVRARAEGVQCSHNRCQSSSVDALRYVQAKVAAGGDRVLAVDGETEQRRQRGFVPRQQQQRRARRCGGANFIAE